MTWRLEVLTVNRLDEFIDICNELWAQAELDHLKFSRDTTRALGMQCINNPAFLCQMAIVGDEVVGCMVGHVVHLIFSDEVIGNEEGIYVRKGTRERTAIASEMLRRFVRFCQDCGAVDVRTGVISNIDNYAVDVFYRRNGFRKIGSIYSLRNVGGK